MSFIQSLPQKRRWISLTPLIDVVFILLMFFMLTTQFSRYSVMSIGVGSASDSNAAAATATDIVRVTVFANNEWRLNGSSLALLDEASLSQFVGVSSVVVTADDTAQLQDIVTFLDALTKAGVTNVVWQPPATEAGR